jgi:hypothetical protein
MEKSQNYQPGIQQYDPKRREELMRSRAVPGISTVTGIPARFSQECIKDKYSDALRRETN